MANLFLPQLITWFRLDEHVKRLKGRVDVLENSPGGVQSVSGQFVDNSDNKNPSITITNAGTHINGLMSLNDFRKLNNLPIFLNNAAAGTGGLQNRLFYLKPDVNGDLQVMMYTNET